MIEVTLIKKQMIAENIVSLVLASADGTRLPAFDPGSHIDLHIDNNTIRQYSLINSLDNGKTYEIAILREAGGRGGSIKLHDSLTPGNTVTISEPRNHFPLQECEHTVLVAGGIGITPILSMAQYLHSQGKSFELHYCARSDRSAAFLAEIQASPFAEHSRLYFDQQKQAFAPQTLAHRGDDSRLFVCGPEGFIQFISNTALAAGWAEERIHYELFKRSAAPASGLGQPFSMVINSSGDVINVAADETALDALVRSGYEIPCSCEQGVCGTCVLEILEGTPDHQDMFLTDKERQQNQHFTPCCSRALTPTLTLKL